jgi:hypothetical protein
MTEVSILKDTHVACNCACERDKHLYCPGPKRLLALDGGGVRGAATVAFLEQIETVISEHLKKPIHLGNWFDLIGGTSTGAIIAGALAMGFTTKDIKKFYFELAPKVFKRPFWRIIGLQAKFDARALRREIDEIVGDCALGSTELVTGFCLVSKRMDTGSPWILANNPRAKYWETKTGGKGTIGNKHYPLANLVRASTAAPFYFDPEWLTIVEGEKPGLFVDGGVTPHNNPSLMLYLMTVLNAYDIRWKTGPEDLTIVSIGTGSHRDRLVPDDLGMGRTSKLAYHALTSLMGDIQTFVLMQMQYLGECLTPWWINSEVGSLTGEKPVDGKKFRFLRYDLRLEWPWIEELREKIGPEKFDEEFGRKLTETEVIRMRSMDDPTIIEDIYNLARIAAKDQVKPEHWIGEMATWCNGQRPSGEPRQMAPRKPDPSYDSIWLIYSAKISVALSYLRSAVVRVLYSPPK